MASWKHSAINGCLKLKLKSVLVQARNQRSTLSPSARIAGGKELQEAQLCLESRGFCDPVVLVEVLDKKEETLAAARLANEEEQVV